MSIVGQYSGNHCCHCWACFGNEQCSHYQEHLKGERRDRGEDYDSTLRAFFMVRGYNFNSTITLYT